MKASPDDEVDFTMDYSALDSRAQQLRSGDQAMYIGSPTRPRHPVDAALRGTVVTLAHRFYDGQLMWTFDGAPLRVPGGFVDAISDRCLLLIAAVGDRGRRHVSASPAG